MDDGFPSNDRNIYCLRSVQSNVGPFRLSFHCRYRSLLPMGHVLIDLLLLTSWIWHATVVLNAPRSLSRPTGVSVAAAYAATDNIGWDPVDVRLDPRFALMLTGTLPAGIVSGSVRPEAGWQTLHRLWDPLWLLVHEAVAIPFWFMIGAWLDSGRGHLGRVMRMYLVGRVVVAAIAIATTGDAKWWILQFLFWVGLAAYGALQAMQWLRRSSRTFA